MRSLLPTEPGVALIAGFTLAVGVVFLSLIAALGLEPEDRLVVRKLRNRIPIRRGNRS